MAGALQVRTVESGADLRRFIRFPWTIYRKHHPMPNWVPPLLVSEKALLDREKCPFFEHGDARYFLAERDGRPVGRIAGIVNDAHTDFYDEPVGFFGFFESFNDQEVAGALVGAAADWVRNRGLEVMRGPMNFSTNETCALLIEGFDEPPTIMMPYNPPYYSDLLAGTGMEPAKVLISYYSKVIDVPQRILQISEKAKHKAGVEFRPLDMKRFDEDVALIETVYNDAWAPNWGFIPMTKAEMAHMAKDLKPIVEPNLVLLAFVRGEIAGFSLAIPDVNEILIRMNGRLLPFGIFQLLLGKRKIRNARIIALGVRRRYQGMGLGSLFYAESLRVAREIGIDGGEASWILEDNADMRKPMELMGADINKRYMVYDLPL